MGLLFALPAAALMWMTAVPGTSWRGALPPPTPEERDLAGRLRGHAVLRQPFDDGHAVNLEAVIEPASPKAPTLASPHATWCIALVMRMEKGPR